jgi:antitoxin (DNA-binding transcriptional repressor) of toxin-antitoxin stability system
MPHIQENENSIGTRQARRRFSEILTRKTPTIILERNNPRALIVPIWTETRWPKPGEMRAMYARARKDAIAAIDSLRKPQ